jgi:hypothetical protein
VAGTKAPGKFTLHPSRSIEEVFMRLTRAKEYGPINLVLALAILCAVVVGPLFAQDDDLNGSKTLLWDTPLQSLATETPSDQDVECFDLPVCHSSFTDFKWLICLSRVSSPFSIYRITVPQQPLSVLRC